MSSVPIELSEYFTEKVFPNYPFVEFPQRFHDERGEILNIADGQLGDVAVIESEVGAIRANHYHKTDWHITYIVSGQLKYFWKSDDETNFVIVNPGQAVFTPTTVPHKMEFLEKSIMIAVARNSRTQEHYEEDTIRSEVM
jgi:quercetin dioxygenase-like cupin family protein